MWPFTKKEPAPPHKENVGRSKLTYHMKDGSVVAGLTFRGHWSTLMGHNFVYRSEHKASQYIDSGSPFRETANGTFINIDQIARVEVVTEDCLSESSGYY